jgi:hypothetical protein
VCSGLDNTTGPCADTPDDLCPGDLCAFGCWAGNNMLQLFAALMDGHTVLDRPSTDPVADAAVPRGFSSLPLLGAGTVLLGMLATTLYASWRRRHVDYQPVVPRASASAGPRCDLY